MIPAPQLGRRCSYCDVGLLAEEEVICDRCLYALPEPLIRRVQRAARVLKRLPGSTEAAHLYQGRMSEALMTLKERVSHGK